jgi:hypothetical protein
MRELIGVVNVAKVSCQTDYFNVESVAGSGLPIFRLLHCRAMFLHFTDVTSRGP